MGTLAPAGTALQRGAGVMSDCVLPLAMPRSASRETQQSPVPFASAQADPSAMLRTVPSTGLRTGVELRPEARVSAASSVRIAGVQH